MRSSARGAVGYPWSVTTPLECFLPTGLHGKVKKVTSILSTTRSSFLLNLHSTIGISCLILLNEKGNHWVPVWDDCNSRQVFLFAFLESLFSWLSLRIILSKPKSRVIHDENGKELWAQGRSQRFSAVQLATLRRHVELLWPRLP